MLGMRRPPLAPNPAPMKPDRTGPRAGNIGYAVGFFGGRTLVPRSGASAVPAMRPAARGHRMPGSRRPRSSAPKGRRRARGGYYPAVAGGPNTEREVALHAQVDRFAGAAPLPLRAGLPVRAIDVQRRRARIIGRRTGRRRRRERSRRPGGSLRQAGSFCRYAKRAPEQQPLLPWPRVRRAGS